ncbi:hypothetical protein L6452_01302 [Arctium lappa]|uniref:Uncharacterized protein n=1 Tax=Arctium lappa TaxID=4217 RepID=A0ACB9FHB4_ARCLA|nr:hypothetical protein L6452_01302 [Arctium lappa]
MTGEDDSSSEDESFVHIPNPNPSHVRTLKVVLQSCIGGWGTLFDQMDNALSEEEKHLESSLNQVNEMMVHCGHGLLQFRPKNNLQQRTNNGLQIVSNANEAHVGEVLHQLGLKNCFDDVIYFEFLNRSSEHKKGDDYTLESIHNTRKALSEL